MSGSITQTIRVALEQVGVNNDLVETLKFLRSGKADIAVNLNASQNSSLQQTVQKALQVTQQSASDSRVQSAQLKQQTAQLNAQAAQLKVQAASLNQQAKQQSVTLQQQASQLRQQGLQQSSQLKTQSAQQLGQIKVQTTQQLIQLKQQAVQEAAKFRQQEQNLRRQTQRASQVQTLTARFGETPQIEELFAQITGGEKARRQILANKAKEFAARNPTITGLEASLLEKAQTGVLPSLLNPRNLKNPSVLTQIAFAGLQDKGGGIGGALGRVGAVSGSTVAGVVGGAAGAALAAAASELIEPLIRGIEEKESRFREAGEAYQSAILSTTSVLQQGSKITNATGGLLPLQQQLDFQQSRAIDIQQTARAQLAPLGVSGATEANVVRSVVSGLSQRGIQASPEEIAQIARAVVGTAVTQRPELLNNFSQFSRDSEDIFSGSPAGGRTALGSLFRSALPGLAKATSGADIVKALKQYQVFGDVAENSDSITSLQRRATGLKEQAEGIAGIEQTAQLKSALQAQIDLYKSPEYVEGQKSLGKLIGQFESLSSKMGTFTEGAFTVFINQVEKSSIVQSASNAASVALGGKSTGKGFFEEVTDAAVLKPLNTVLKQFGIGTVSTNKDISDANEAEERDKQRERAVAGLNSFVTPDANQSANSLLEKLGLADKVTKANDDLSRNTVAQLAGVDSILAKSRVDKDLSDRRPGLLQTKLDLLDERSKERGSIFSNTDSDRFASLTQEGSDLTEKLKTARELVSEQQSLRGTFKPLQRQNLIDDAKKALRIANNKGGLSAAEQKTADEFEELDKKTAKSSNRKVEDVRLDRSLAAQARVRQAERTPQKEIDEKNAGELGRLTENIVAAERRVLQLRDQGVSIIEKQTAILTDRLSKINKSYDTSTVTGLQRATSESEKPIQDLLKASDSKLIAVDRALKSVDEVLKTQGLSKEDRGAFQAKRQALLETRNEVSREGNDPERRRIDNITRRNEITLIPLERRRGLIDTTTFEGSETASRLDETILQKRISDQQKLIDQLQVRAKSGGPGAQADLETIEKLRQEVIPSEQKKIGEVRLGGSTVGFQRAEASADLNISLANSSRLLTEESSKRASLIAGLEQSRGALASFADAAKSQAQSKEKGLVDTVRQLHKNGEHGPAFLDNLSDEDLKRLDVEELKRKGNEQAAELGFGNIFGETHGLGFANPNNDSPFAQGLNNQRSHLQNSVFENQFNLRTLPDQTAKRRAQLGLEQTNLRHSLFDRAEYGAGPTQNSKSKPISSLPNAQQEDNQGASFGANLPTATPHEVTPAQVNRQSAETNRKAASRVDDLLKSSGGSSVTINGAVKLDSESIDQITSGITSGFKETFQQ